MMTDEIVEFELSDQEEMVRTYACTELKKWFSKPVRGYLTITNKRVLYHSYSTNHQGTSAVLSEIPIQDVAGFSSITGS